MIRPKRSGTLPGLLHGLLFGLLAGLAVIVAPYGAAEESGPPQEPAPHSLEPVAADRELLEEIMREGAVATETPRPKVTQYVADVVTGTMERILSWLFGSRSFDDTALRVVQWMIIALVAALTLMVLYQWFRWWQRRSLETEAVRPEVVHLAASPETDWRAELEKRLHEGNAPAALEALWWWLAEHLGVEQADASWTTRELARRAGRRDLMPQVRHWDRLVYGGGAVDVESVRGLWSDLRESLP